MTIHISSRRQRPFIATRSAVMAMATALFLAGCFDYSSLRSGANPADPTDAEDAMDADPAENVDPFVAAAAELEPGEQPFLDAAQPFMQAIANRNYAKAFGHLSPTAKQRFSRNQFDPADDEQQYAKNDAEPIVNPTAEQFVQLMQEVEEQYGMPAHLEPPTVETDPEILERRDPLLAAFEIGAMPDSIPVAHRKAAVQGWIYCKMTDAQIKQAAEQEGIDEAEYRQLLAESESGGEGPYFKLKTVVIDEGAGPVVGYFEFAPPSMLD
jgi:hypothetical protein